MPIPTTSVRAAFDARRARSEAHHNWALAWFLANEFCDRFYVSHGIAPQVIDHDGLGYYGIALAYVPCAVNGKHSAALGRLTMFGDVENWRRGGPGDHGLETIAMCEGGEPTSEIVKNAILHMDLPAIPKPTHARCRHKRQGASYQLVFQIAAILAMGDSPPAVWNDPACSGVASSKLSSEELADPGVFHFVHERKLFISGDGRLLDGSSEDLWLRYMRGETLESLVAFVDGRIRGDAGASPPQ